MHCLLLDHVEVLTGDGAEDVGDVVEGDVPEAEGQGQGPGTFE